MADPIYGTNEDDNISGTNGDDTIYGSKPNPQGTILGQGDDTIDGKSGNDFIYGGNGDDTIIGGAGNDTLNGGNGSDTFVFNFTFNKTAGSTNTIYFRDGNAPSESADYKAWLNYTTQLEAWRAELSALYGDDQDMNNTFDVDITVNGGSAKKPIYSTMEFIGDNSFTYAIDGSLTIQGEGTDTIVDWRNGGDKLKLNGLSNDSNSDYYWGKWITYEITGEESAKISFDGGSITLLGKTSADFQALVDGDFVIFG